MKIENVEDEEDEEDEEDVEDEEDEEDVEDEEDEEDVEDEEDDGVLCSRGKGSGEAEALPSLGGVEADAPEDDGVLCSRGKGSGEAEASLTVESLPFLGNIVGIIMKKIQNSHLFVIQQYGFFYEVISFTLLFIIKK